MKNKKQIGEGGLNTVIGKDSIIDGTIEVKGGLRVDGIVRGKVSTTESLAIGDGGRIEADMTTKTAIIGGKVVGAIFAEEKIELQSKAVVEGDITTKNLIVEEGAIFHGMCNMKKTPSKSIPQEKSDQVDVPR